MKNKLISFILALCLLIAIPLSARYKYNPFTRKLDYYEPVSGSELGDLGDVTLTGLATGNVLYYNGTAWVNLATEADTNVLMLAGGVPTWAAGGAPAAHAASHEVGGVDLVDHNLLTNYVVNEHIDHTTITLTAAGLITGGGTIAADRTFTLTAATIETAIDTLANLTSIQGQAVTFAGSLNVEANSNINQDLTTDATGILFGRDVQIDSGSWAAFIVDSHDDNAYIEFQEDNVIKWTSGMHYDGGLEYFKISRGLPGTNTAILITSTEDVQIPSGDLMIMNGEVFRFYEAGSANYVAFEAPDTLTVNTLWRWMAADGPANEVIGTDGSNDLIWRTHDELAGFVANEHIDWTAAASAFSNSGTALFTGDVTFNEDIFATWGDAADHMVITQNSESGIEGQSLIHITDDREGATATGEDEATLRISSADGYALSVQNPGKAYFGGDTTQIEDVFMTWGDAADHMTIIQNSETGIENQALIYIEDARDGATADEPIEATLHISTVGAYSFYISQGEALFADDVTLTNDFDLSWTLAADNAVITQTATAGIEDVPLINIDDDRTGTTHDEASEATIYMDTDGRTAIYIADGFFETVDNMYLSGDVVVNGTQLMITDSIGFKLGTQADVHQDWNINDTADAHWNIRMDKYGADDTTAVVYSQDVYFWGNTALDDWLSPTFVIVNDENADQYDYTAVVIGERTQADVEVAHYFDFYAITGTLRGSVDPTTTEIAAIFRFGPNGTGVPDNATTPGDVLIEGNFEVDGNVYVDGEVFQGDYVVSIVVNFDDASPATICTVADGYIVIDVYVEITTVWNGNGTIDIGDGGTADGFLDDANITQTGLGYYGSDTHARGAYLDDGKQKIYTGGDTVDATLVVGTSTQGIATVYVHITRLK